MGVITRTFANQIKTGGKLDADGLDLTDTFAFTGTVTGAGGVNTPAFRVKLSTNQSITSATTTKIQFNTEDFDTDGCYDNATNYRFTPTVAGKYFIYLGVNYDHSGGSPTLYNSYIYKNGSLFEQAYKNQVGSSINHYGNNVTVNTIVTMNGSTDYIEAFARQSGITGGLMTAAFCFFGGYKIIE